jgi:hypothetical protein
LALFEGASVESYMLFTEFNKRNDPDLVILKDKNKKRIKIPKRLEIQAEPIRQNLKKINAALDQHVITLNISDDEFKQLNERRARKRSKWGANDNQQRPQGNPNADFIWKKSLYRVFHENFNHHGRFYGGFWQNLPNKKRWKDADSRIRTDGIQFRRRIDIDGEKTVEIDFSNMHTRLLYHRKNIRCPKDPYKLVVRRYPKINGQKVLRGHVKRAMNIIIHVSEEDDPVAILANVWNGDDSNVTSMDHEFAYQLIEAILDVHDKIALYFLGRYPVELMNTDSEIAEKVMLSMIDKFNTVALPVHDSFIVQEKHELDLMDEMETAYEEEYGFATPVSFERDEARPEPTSAGTSSSGATSTIWRDKMDEQLIKAKDELL